MVPFASIKIDFPYGPCNGHENTARFEIASKCVLCRDNDVNRGRYVGSVGRVRGPLEKRIAGRGVISGEKERNKESSQSHFLREKRD